MSISKKVSKNISVNILFLYHLEGKLPLLLCGISIASISKFVLQYPYTESFKVFRIHEFPILIFNMDSGYEILIEFQIGIIVSIMKGFILSPYFVNTK